MKSISDIINDEMDKYQKEKKNPQNWVLNKKKILPGRYSPIKKEILKKKVKKRRKRKRRSEKTMIN